MNINNCLWVQFSPRSIVAVNKPLSHLGFSDFKYFQFPKFTITPDQIKTELLRWMTVF